MQPSRERLKGPSRKMHWPLERCHQSERLRGDLSKAFPGRSYSERDGEQHSSQPYQTVCGDGCKRDRAVEAHLQGTRQTDNISPKCGGKEVGGEVPHKCQFCGPAKGNVYSTGMQQHMPTGNDKNAGDE